VAARGTTFAKQERDRAKKAKAAQKRERREARGSESEDQPIPSTSGEGDIAPEELLRMVEELHKAYADERISLEEFDERKQELMARITV
jgi:hypothetical protein